MHIRGVILITLEYGQGNILARIKLFLLDMDGTFYLGRHLLPGALEFMDALARAGLDYLFLTNNSSRDAGAYADKLGGLGFSVDPAKILTSGEATVRHLRARQPEARVYLLGTPSLEGEFRRGGIELVEEEPDLVVLGFDTTLTYRKLERACTFIRRGAGFIATHPDVNCPTEEGFVPDAGAMIAMIKTSTGVSPEVVGKPRPMIVEAAAAKTGIPTAAMAMVGDRLYTDVALGMETGVATILVLTGETVLADLPASPFQPDLVASSLAEVARWVRGEAGRPD